MRDITATLIGFIAGAICVLCVPTADGLLLGLFVFVVVTLMLIAICDYFGWTPDQEQGQDHG